MKKILIFSLMLLTTIVFSEEIKSNENSGPKPKVIVTDINMSNIKPMKKENATVKTQKKIETRSIASQQASQQTPRRKGLPQWIKEDGLLKSKFMSWGGIGTHLFGYYDQRYEGYDKTAYLKAATYNFGMEYYKANLGDYIPALKDIRAGFNIAFQKRNGFKQKTLRAMGLIPEKTVPEDEKNINPESWLNLGFFMGLDNKWYGIDLGLTVSLNPYYEDERVFGDGTTEEGRGWLWGSGTTIYPNIQVRLGKSDSAHFVFNVLRDDYDVKYGVINVYLALPLGEYFGLDIGGYLYQTDSIFIAPKVKFKDFTAKVKFGTIINYQDEVFQKVAIFDSLYGNLSLSYEW